MWLKVSAAHSGHLYSQRQLRSLALRLRCLVEGQPGGLSITLTPDSEFAATAAAEGLIATGALAKVRSQKQAEENSPTAQEILEEQD
jgi:hypothetical protein